ncbi:hypothetical protein RhiirA5_380858 [Rhizophagus irregularis]|uniref:Uncharacterized protein n=1 Tax=Rhizophagus irregularis TaxID=588596 RepID=A0A2N0P6V1_9GLOM|nr:hypothetical protein RhiirA5_380858 [Rhizophagus irregularis]
MAEWLRRQTRNLMGSARADTGLLNSPEFLCYPEENRLNANWNKWYCNIKMDIARFQSDCNLKVKRFRTETWNSRQVNVWKKEAGFGSYTRMFATLLTFFIISFLRF